jgi:hypothetical protein
MAAGIGLDRKKASAEESSFERLRSEFSFDSRMPNGELQESHVVIYSSAFYTPEKKEGQVVFDVQNEGPRPMAMFLNVPISSDNAKYLPLARERLGFKPGEKETFTVPIHERPRVRPTTVILYGEDGKRAALETAGFYVPAAGDTQFSDDELWKEH